jgi:hypothetical protein
MSKDLILLSKILSIIGRSRLITEEKQVLFHGSPYKFDSFDINKIGSGYSPLNEHSLPNNDSYGIFFTNNKDYAKYYALEHINDSYYNNLTQEENKGYLYTVEVPSDKYIIDSIELLSDQSTYIENKLHEIAKYISKKIDANNNIVYKDKRTQRFNDIKGTEFILKVKKLFNNNIKNTWKFLYEKFGLCGIKYWDDEEDATYVIYSEEKEEFSILNIEEVTN